MEFEINEIVIVKKDIHTADQRVYLYAGTKLKIKTISVRQINRAGIPSKRHVYQYQGFNITKDLDSGYARRDLYSILEKDILNGSVISISKIRNDKINEILNND